MDQIFVFFVGKHFQVILEVLSDSVYNVETHSQPISPYLF